jgi:hypothetical protein
MDDGLDVLRGFLEKVARTDDVELDCEQVFAVVDVYAEAVARGDEISEFLPLVKHHLEMCRDCQEEYEALMRILESGSR